MHSEKSKTRSEDRLYGPIREFLNGIFGSYVEERPLMGAPFSYEENPYLEITANKRRFSEMLKKEFDDKTLSLLSVEKNVPDIMGYVQRKPSSKKELITVEVKNKPIRLMDILQARFYQEIFKATFGLLISSKGILEEKVRFVLDTDVGRNVIRGKIIIARFHENPYQKYGFLEIHPRFQNSVPELFKKFCKP